MKSSIKKTFDTSEPLSKALAAKSEAALLDRDCREEERVMLTLVQALNKLVELEKQATPGPWINHSKSAESCSAFSNIQIYREVEEDLGEVCQNDKWWAGVSDGFEKPIDAYLATQARNVFPELLECALALSDLLATGGLSGHEFQLGSDARKRSRDAIDALFKKLTTTSL